MTATSEKVCDEIRRAIDSDPGIRDASHITVTTEKHGFWVFGSEDIVLMGRVRSEHERARVQELADAHAHGKPVNNNLSIRQES